MEYVFEHFKLSNTKQPIVLHDTKIDYKTESTVNWHRNIEIFLGKSGKGMVMIDADRFEIGEGDIFVANSCSLHDIKTDGNLDFYCLIIDPDFCAENDINVEDIVFERRIDDDVAKKAFTVVAMYLVLSVGATMAVSAVEGVTLNVAMFECVSAIATVGLTLGITPGLSVVSEIILVFGL